MEFTANSDAPVDFEQLRDIAGEDEDLMVELSEMYLTQTRGILDDLKTALENGDAAEVKNLAHKAVGGSATCGMNAVVPFFRELETRGAAQNLDNAESVLAKAENAFAEIAAVLAAQK